MFEGIKRFEVPRFRVQRFELKVKDRFCISSNRLTLFIGSRFPVLGSGLKRIYLKPLNPNPEPKSSEP
jgi:hypothetical protein